LLWGWRKFAWRAGGTILVNVSSDACNVKDLFIATSY
jgi:hypothetical protein